MCFSPVSRLARLLLAFVFPDLVCSTASLITNLTSFSQSVCGHSVNLTQREMLCQVHAVYK